MADLNEVPCVLSLVGGQILKEDGVLRAVDMASGSETFAVNGLDLSQESKMSWKQIDFLTGFQGKHSPWSTGSVEQLRGLAGVMGHCIQVGQEEVCPVAKTFVTATIIFSP